MDARRRLLLDSLKKQFIFLEGSGELTNSISSSFREARIGSYIGVDAPTVAIVGTNDRTEQGYGWFKIQADFTGYKKLCIETVGATALTRQVTSAVGYSKTYSGSLMAPRLPDVYEKVEWQSERTVRQFDISAIDGERFIVGTITNVSSLSFNTDALKIFNIWLE